MPVIAEDTGIEVEALAGAAGRAIGSAMPASPPTTMPMWTKCCPSSAGRGGPSPAPGQVRDRGGRQWPDGRETRAEGTVGGLDSGGAPGPGRFWLRPGVRPLRVRRPHVWRAGGGLARCQERTISPGAGVPARWPSGWPAKAPRTTGRPLRGTSPPRPLRAPRPGGRGGREPARTGPRAGRAAGGGCPGPCATWPKCSSSGSLSSTSSCPRSGGHHEALHVLASANPFLPIAALVLEVLSLVAYFEFTRSPSSPGKPTPAWSTSGIQLSSLALALLPGAPAVGYSLGYRLLLRSGVSARMPASPWRLGSRLGRRARRHLPAG